MRFLVLALPVALLLTACSGSSRTALSQPTSASPSVDTTAPAPTPTSTATAGPTPTTTRVKPAIAGDVDGDGNPDTVRTTATLLTVVLSGTGRTVTAPIHAEAPRNAPVVGSNDVDRDGFAEVFLQTAQGASTSFVTPYRFDGTTLRELQLDGGPLRLGIGGSVTHGDGFRCTPAGMLEVRSAESTDGKAFTIQIKTYRLAANTLRLVKSSTLTAKQGDLAVQQSYSVDCGSVGEGQ
ncbi:MAG: hypothetical protein JWM02_547 [Frankiales bacterium]|nr:hypothetical protein [Frankiales bacterium]